MTTTPDHDFTPPAMSTGTQLNERAAADFQKLRTSIPDPDLAPVPEMSDLELIAKDLAKDVDDEKPFILPVKTRPGYALQFNTDITYEQLEKWKKLSKDRKAADGVDLARLSGLVIANQCTGILKNGRTLVDADGDSLTFASDEVRAMYDTPKAADAARKLIGKDANVQSIADAVTAAAGWGDEVSEVDPTAAD